MTSINDKQLSSITYWRNAGLVITGLGLSATILSRRFPQLKWPHPLAVKWIGPGLAGTGALLTIIKQAQIWLTPTNVEKKEEEETEELGLFFDYDTAKIYSAQKDDLYAVLDEGEDTQIGMKRKIKCRPGIPSSLIPGAFILDAVQLPIESYFLDLCTTPDCVPSINWIDPVHEMEKLEANLAMTEGKDIDDKGKQDALSEKTDEQITAEATVYTAKEFLKMNGQNGSVKWLAGRIDVDRARAQLQLLFAMKAGAGNFNKMSEEQIKAREALSINDAAQWNGLHQQLRVIREKAAPLIIHALTEKDGVVLNRRALKLADLNVRQVLKARWKEMTLFDAIEKDGDIVWSMMDIGKRPAEDGYIASEWTEAVLEETSKLDLLKIIEEHPNLLAKGVLNKKQVKERFEKEKTAVTLHVLQILLVDSNAKGKLLTKCEWLIPDQMKEPIKALRKALRQAKKKQQAIESAHRAFRQAALTQYKALLAN